MGVIIDKSKCVGCGQCVEICPGNLIQKAADNTAYLKYPSECWNCTACMKECRHQAISLLQAPEAGGRGARMTLKQTGELTEWEIKKPDGSSTLIVTDTSEANKY